MRINLMPLKIGSGRGNLETFDPNNKQATNDKQCRLSDGEERNKKRIFHGRRPFRNNSIPNKLPTQ